MPTHIHIHTQVYDSILESEGEQEKCIKSNEINDGQLNAYKLSKQHGY